MHSTRCYKLQYNNPQSEAASGLYTRACKRGQRGQLWASLTGHSRGLLALGQVHAAGSVEVQGDNGIRSVSIDRICGSENRSTDFDRDFNPLREHNRDRWLSIAQARQRGRALPPVALIQVGDLYFVRDGHHRISVARALGQKAIEATVVVWQVAGPLPWETQAQAEDPRFEGLINKVRGASARLQERVLLGLNDLMGTAGTASRRPVVSQPGVDGL